MHEREGRFIKRERHARADAQPAQEKGRRVPGKGKYQQARYPRQQPDPEQRRAVAAVETPPDPRGHQGGHQQGGGVCRRHPGHR